MANYRGNPLGGVKLVGPETVGAFSAFLRMLGQSGMGLGELLRMGSSGVPRVDRGNPVIQGLVQSGVGSGMGSRNSVLMDLLSSVEGMGSGVEGGVVSDHRGDGGDVLGELANAVVEILSRSPDRFVSILRNNPGILANLVSGITKEVHRG